VLPAVRAAQLDGFLTGVEKAPEQHISITNDDKMVSKEINPAYVSWVAWDQAVLGYMLLSLTRETFIHVSHCSTAAQVWSTLSDLYSSQTRACAVNTCIALATTKKNQPSVSDYYAKISHFADELAASGNPLRNDEIVAYLLAGLDEDFNPVFTAIVERVDPITPSELYSQLLSFKHHTNLQAHNSSGVHLWLWLHLIVEAHLEAGVLVDWIVALDAVAGVVTDLAVASPTSSPSLLVLLVDHHHRDPSASSASR
jgi:hypothetical protein